MLKKIIVIASLVSSSLVAAQAIASPAALITYNKSIYQIAAKVGFACSTTFPDGLTGPMAGYYGKATGNTAWSHVTAVCGKNCTAHIIVSDPNKVKSNYCYASGTTDIGTISFNSSTGKFGTLSITAPGWSVAKVCDPTTNPSCANSTIYFSGPTTH